MYIPHVPKKPELLRELSTSNIDELAKFQGNRNRQYTQLEAGELNVQFREASLENVFIFKETLNLGTRIQAAPASSIIPFAYVLPPSSQIAFCGQTGVRDSFIQASGGTWDINFKGKLEYIGCAFNRDYFYASYELLKGQAIPSQYLVSQIVPSQSAQQQAYALGLANILYFLHTNPFIYCYPDVIRLLCSQVFKFTSDALPTITDSTHPSFRKYSFRIAAAKRVIDYLQEHAKELPDMQTLCKVAGTGERSLQYGFRDYLGMTPIQYLRVIRLNGVRAELQGASYNQTKVTSVAVSWGFIELGHFAKEYKKLFKELPSTTLHR